MKKYNTNRSFKELVNPNDERLKGYVSNDPQYGYSNQPVRGTRVARVSPAGYYDNSCC